AAGGDPGDALVGAVADQLVGGGEQPVLGAEVVAERPRGRVRGGLGDVADADVVDPLLGDELPGGLDDLPPAGIVVDQLGHRSPPPSVPVGAHWACGAQSPYPIRPHRTPRSVFRRSAPRILVIQLFNKNGACDPDHYAPSPVQRREPHMSRTEQPPTDWRRRAADLAPDG